MVHVTCRNNDTRQSHSNSEGHSQQLKHDPISLNNGMKLKVDTNMMIHIQHMEEDIALFEKSASNNYGLLAHSLQNHLDKLTSNCTMKGNAHDELHKWLLPYMEEVEKLKEQSPTHNQFNIIKAYFVSFHQYFE